LKSELIEVSEMLEETSIELNAQNDQYSKLQAKMCELLDDHEKLIKENNRLTSDLFISSEKNETLEFELEEM